MTISMAALAITGVMMIMQAVEAYLDFDPTICPKSLISLAKIPKFPPPR